MSLLMCVFLFGFTFQLYSASQLLVTRCESGEIDSGFCDPRDVSVNMGNCFNHRAGCLFTSQFVKDPSVTYGLIHLDSDKAHNTRVAVNMKSSARGMSIDFSCWADSWCYQARVSWMACGLVYA